MNNRQGDRMAGLWRKERGEGGGRRAKMGGAKRETSALPTLFEPVGETSLNRCVWPCPNPLILLIARPGKNYGIFITSRQLSGFFWSSSSRIFFATYYTDINNLIRELFFFLSLWILIKRMNAIAIFMNQFVRFGFCNRVLDRISRK